MRLDNRMNRVVAELEYRVGSTCYNANSYDGWTDTQGCGFRYPISMLNPQGNEEKYRSNICFLADFNERDISNEEITSMKYKFGSNSLYIGRALISVLNYLEERYDLDFNAMEEKIVEE